MSDAYKLWITTSRSTGKTLVHITGSSARRHCSQENASCLEVVHAADHDRLMKEKDAKIAELEALVKKAMGR